MNPLSAAEGCTGSITVISMENGISNYSSNSGVVYCIHFHINTLGKFISSSWVAW